MYLSMYSRSMTNNSSSGGGLGFTGLLTVAFIVLKLCKVIDWSWWWVLSPMWIMILIALIAIIAGIILAARR